MTTAVLLTLLGALSRLLPHPPNAVALGAIALYAGARLPRRFAFVVPVLALALSDLVLDFGTGRAALTPIRAAVYGCFLLTVLAGRLAASAAGPLRLAALAVGSAVFFFLTTNFANWLQFDTYPKTAAGLALCYAAAIPWFWNTLLADLAGTAVFFGLDALSRRAGRDTRRVAALVAFAAVAAASPGRAQSAALPPPSPTPSAPALSESVVVTATATPEEPAEVGAATTIVTREEIDRHGYRTVSDALRSVPGLDVARSGPEGAITSVFLRGANSTGALLLIDGVRMNSVFFGGYDFSSLTTENVERIEIVRGPFSALYGSDALGGVIQIFTRGSAIGLSGRAAVEAGNAGQREGEASVSWGGGPWGMAASVRDGRADNDRPNSDWRQKSGAARLDFRSLSDARVGLEAAIVDGETGTPGPVGRESPRARSTWREERFAVPISFRPAEGHETSVLLANVSSHPTFADADQGFAATTRLRSYQARVTETWTAGASRLSGFAAWERGEVDDASNFGTNLDGTHTTLWGAGVEETARLFRGFTATAGLRYDRHSQFGSAWSPRATFAWLSADSLWKLRASAGSAFRAPTVGELYYPFSGNPELKPERSTAYEVGAERSLPRGSVEVSAFWNEFRDLIVYDFAANQDRNLGRARARGIEGVIRQRITAALSVDLGYTFLDARDLSADDTLIRRPRHRASLSMVFTPLAALSIAPRATLVGRRRDQSATTGSSVEDPSYVRYDLFVRYAWGRLTPYARLENATDRRYEEAAGFPAARRRIAGGLEVGF
ncbi:MAG: TonB-dependent receptor [Acidobacteriota bacterium]